MQKELSLTNGISFIGSNDLGSAKDEITSYWDSIISVMDKEDMEKANDFTNADTETVEGKIEYVRDYLSIAKDNLIIG